MDSLHTVFKSTLLAGNPVLILPIIVIILICVASSIYYRRPFWKTLSKRTSVIIVTLLLFQMWFLGTQLITYKNVVVAYQMGEYETVIGQVQEYKPPSTNLNPWESFSVDGVSFSYGGGECRNYFGFDKTSINGGPITQNGLFVRVSYVVYDGKNIIVQLDIIDVE